MTDKNAPGAKLKLDLQATSTGLAWRAIDAAMPLLADYHRPALHALSKADKEIFARAVITADRAAEDAIRIDALVLRTMLEEMDISPSKVAELRKRFGAQGVAPVAEASEFRQVATVFDCVTAPGGPKSVWGQGEFRCSEQIPVGTELYAKLPKKA